MLLFVSLSHLLKQKFYHKSIWQESRQLAKSSTEHNSFYLVELLQKSAVENLLIYRQIEARYVGSVATIVTSDFDALYAYKRGDYQRCLQLSTQNVYARCCMLLTCPMF